MPEDSTDSARATRRAYLGAITASSAAIAGCSGVAGSMQTIEAPGMEDSPVHRGFSDDRDLIGYTEQALEVGLLLTPEASTELGVRQINVLLDGEVFECCYIEAWYRIQTGETRQTIHLPVDETSDIVAASGSGNVVDELEVTVT